jgi:hypothetical protein
MKGNVNDLLFIHLMARWWDTYGLPYLDGKFIDIFFFFFDRWQVRFFYVKVST